MKLNKKKVLVTSLAVSLIAILSFGTIAWFNATDDITNTFKIADSNNDNEPDFDVEVFETKEGVEVDAKEYIDILPNEVLDKNPTVRNTGDYDMYTRVVVTLSDAATWIAASEKYSLAANDLEILEKMIDLNAKWVRYEEPVYNPTANTLTYVYYYADVVEGVQGTGTDKTTEALFTKVTIPYQLQSEDMNYGVDKGFTIDVKADAIQSDNIISDTTTIENSEAYTAFSIADWTAGSAYPEPTP